MKKIYIILALFAIVIISGITSCRKKAEVPADAATYDPGFPAGCTRVSILQLKNILGSGGLPVQITDNIAVEAYITADDRSGNFYKNIMIQDSSSGIALLLEKSGLYNDYPVGRKIYVKCKGLYLSAYGGFKQLGYSLDETKALVGVPAALFNTVVVKANYDPTLQQLNKLIKHVTLADLKSSVNNEALMGCLIKMDSNVQFQSSQLGTTYAQAPSISSGTDRYLEQCGNAASIVLRTSGYCKFAGNPWPKGRGALTAIYSRYNSTAQLLIRDENDVQFTDSIRCDGVVIQPATPITIKTLRELYLGTGVKLGNLQIHGTIISSLKDSNISSGGYYMQDESGRGINIYATGTSYALGDSLTIDLDGDSLINYRNNLEIKKGANSSLVFTLVGTGKTVTPKVVTAAALYADLMLTSMKDRVYECTLVQIVNASYPTAAMFAGNNPILDASGTIIGFCYNRAPYTTTPLPTGSVSITGVAANFNATPELIIRKLSDVQ
jgi:hypothetical protein